MHPKKSRSSFKEDTCKAVKSKASAPCGSKKSKENSCQFKKSKRISKTMLQFSERRCKEERQKMQEGTIR